MSNRSSLPIGFTAENTLFFPISGNPIGFNHFAAAEWILRANSNLERVLFVLSNGRHPDPTKADAEVSGDARLAVCQAALEAVADPEQSLLAKRAAAAGLTLRLTPDCMAVTTIEFDFDYAVRTAEVVPRLQTFPGEGKSPLHWFAGSDLIRRMANPAIFSDADLALLAAQCRYRVLERDGDNLAPALEALRERRGISLHCEAYPLAEVPDWLAPFLALSSTQIRQAMEAGDPITGMLPRPAAERIIKEGRYRQGRTFVTLTGTDGTVLSKQSEWTYTMNHLRQALDDEAAALHRALDVRREEGRPYSLSLVETTTGGLITHLLAGRAGASRFFRQARFAYDAVAKTSLVGGDLPGASAVSAEAVTALAEAMRAASGADYALAESGMAGPPDGTRRSLKYGLCWFALAGPEGVTTDRLQLNPFLTRKEHQLRFSSHALQMIRSELS